MEDNYPYPSPVTPPTPSPIGQNVRKPMIDGTVGAMVMGIIGISLGCFGWIYFIGWMFSIASLILAILAMKRGNKKIEIYNQSPEKYSRASLGMLKAAKYTGIAGVIVAPIMFVIGIILTILIILLASGDLDRMF